MAGSSIMDNLFQRTLDDLIKGLRISLIGETSFISKAMEEIRSEIKSTDLDTKSTALQKLSYLSSLHFHDMSFGSFHVVELMSSTRFSHKRIAYQSASQSFDDSTSVLVLITNQLRKDLSSNNEFEVSLALECLSRIANLDLARDLSPEIFTLLASSKICVRKKAIGVTLRVFEKYPDSARVCFKRLVENLENSDHGVLSATVGVFSELAARDPGSYLPLAPEFYRVFVDCKSNWVLIKVLKIFARLAPLEPRLAKRIVEPICDLMRQNGAKSVVFECIRTVAKSFGDYESAVRLAVVKVQEFLVEDDPNLKYLALKALTILAPDHPWAVSENKEIVIKSLSDSDPNIKRESLNLVMTMVSENNMVEISRVLMNYVVKSDPEFCNEILGLILSKFSRNVYEIVVDFEWYVSILGEMARVPNCQKGDEIERQLVDIGVRVRDVRPELVRVSRDLLIDPALLGNVFLHRILSAAAWISGEYVEFSRNPFELIEALLQPRTNLLPSSIRAVYIQSTYKVLVFCLHFYFSRSEVIGSEDHSFEDLTDDSVINLLNKIESAIGPLSVSHDVEVEERSRNMLCFIELIRRGVTNIPSQNEDSGPKNESEAYKIVELVQDVFSEEIGPVSITAQERVPLPENLALKENLEDLDQYLPKIETTFSLESPVQNNASVSSPTLEKGEESEPSNESTSLLTEHRKRHGLYYLPSEKNESSSNYPPANDLQSREFADDLVKLADQALVPKKKSNHTKPRPMVVKLDGDEEAASVKPQPNDDSLSEAVREALLGSDSKPNSSEKRSSKGKEKVYSETPETRKSKNQMHDKDRRNRSSNKVDDNSDGNLRALKKKSSHRHGKHKSQKRIDVNPQAQVIQDFLL